MADDLTQDFHFFGNGRLCSVDMYMDHRGFSQFN